MVVALEELRASTESPRSSEKADCDGGGCLPEAYKLREQIPESSSKSPGLYEEVGFEGDDCLSDVDDPREQVLRSRRRTELSTFLLKLISIASVATLTLYYIFRSEGSADVHLHPLTACGDKRVPSVRREWRTLTADQKQSYISALLCLRAAPSQIHDRANVSRFDDFAWTHENIGSAAHEAASFLTWHRGFLAAFEDSLRQYCAYSGPLPYWDWTIDWKDPTKSPVFDSKLGFGGNGDPAMPSPKSDGWCLTDGPFAGAMIPFHGRDWTPHCLARRFANDTTFDAHLLRPDYIQSVVWAHHDYFKMLMSMEKGPHNVVPHGINGVFKSFLAPADPLFWLHHGQLDRLYWAWQQKDPRQRLAYNGPSSSGSELPARLDDVLAYQGLRNDVSVQDVLVTDAGSLCYRYDRMHVGRL